MKRVKLDDCKSPRIYFDGVAAKEIPEGVNVDELWNLFRKSSEVVTTFLVLTFPAFSLLITPSNDVFLFDPEDQKLTPSGGVIRFYPFDFSWLGGCSE